MSYKACYPIEQKSTKMYMAMLNLNTLRSCFFFLKIIINILTFFSLKCHSEVAHFKMYRPFETKIFPLQPQIFILTFSTVLKALFFLLSQSFSEKNYYLLYIFCFSILSSSQLPHLLCCQNTTHTFFLPQISPVLP